MKKLRFNYLSTFSIKAMLTPFLLVCFLLGFVNATYGQKNICPDPKTPNGCIDEVRTATVDIATLWGSSGCPATFEYTERRCNGFSVFEVFLSEDWDLVMSNQYAMAYNAHYNSISMQGQAAIDALMLKENALLTKAALNNSATILINTNPQAYNCATGGILTGRFYEGPCAFNCKTIVKTSTSSFSRTSKIVCGTNCCLSIQDFCLKDGKVVTEGPNKYFSVDKADCISNPTEGCNTNIVLGGIVISSFKSSCMSVCNLNESQKVIPNLSNANIQSNFLEANDLKAFVANNPQTRLIGVSFTNAFSGKVVIIDMSGRQVYETSFSKDDATTGFSIECNSYPAGVYVINFQDLNGNMITEKITLQ